nr:hypothetical protein [Pyrinomonadaceae bacterium]
EGSIQTMHSFTTKEAADRFLVDNGIQLPNSMQTILEKKPFDLFSNARNPACLLNVAQFFEHKNYGGWGIGFDFGGWNLNSPFNKNISSLRTQWDGNGVFLFQNFNLSGPSLFTRSRCNTRKNLRDIGWNDRASSILIY